MSSHTITHCVKGGITVLSQTERKLVYRARPSSVLVYCTRGRKVALGRQLIYNIEGVVNSDLALQ